MMHDKAYTIRWGVRALVLVAVILVLWWLLFAEKDNHLEMGIDDGINVTPEQIQHIQTIGQWEFLSISNEELVDTTRKGIFTDDHLARIYYGTVRLGIDMQKMDSTWITTQGDSVTLWLPRPAILDNNFIDEARTKSFHESGRWTARDRETHRRAQQRMLRYSLTPQNIETARKNGDAQMRRLMLSMGYQHVNIQWK